MRVRIVNCPDKNFKPFVERAVLFYADKLISKRLSENINLKVKFNKKLDVYAFASIVDYNASGKAREFLIEIHPCIGAKEIFRTLAHEMVHIKQFANNETNESLSRWKGTYINSEEVDYYEHPWELEAYGLETGLYCKFAIEENLWEVFEDIKDPSLPLEQKPILWKKNIC